jgi:hypothetical protein
MPRRFSPCQRHGRNLTALRDRLARRVPRDPAADVCRSFLLLKLHALEIAEPYLEACCSINNAPESSRPINKMTRQEILDWLRYVAAARLAENVPDDFDRLLKIVYP